MSVNPSDLILVLPEFHTLDMFTKEGGFHTSQEIGSEVDDLFLPGIIVGSDSSESARYQYRKFFIKNVSESPVMCRVYGYNTKRNNIVRIALEKDGNQVPKIDGSEVIKDYLTAPQLYGEYDFSEIHSDDSRLVGSDGILSAGRAQGIWAQQECLKNMSDDASDNFFFGAKYYEL